ncbi:Mog1p/PsbP-like protein [Cucurbitaria berberidis CBS 394.84]|uniref:Mog1p/PsbP-like protein n=1 Tax=Cucurbitaria berberidis CBS 394.84 TaxID=1168544 RepID=A0A9P4GF43_9PLEO|nr:Mog1p/PsbP-like protein [Cucurbitaria berberidis CBS 394.84]KAF1844030.1 Mog1p/PsbP-like protein [Cucurbitaria berberidis CBS 394.84]
MSFTNTPLYGGAITVDLPSGFADTSQIRQVPDHQEVYLDAEGYSSVVVEILEYVHKSSDDEALQYHFADLVDGTGDATTIVEQGRAQLKSLPNAPLLTLTFIQTPPTPNPNPRRKTPEFTYIHLLLLRLKEQATDLMITINIPHYAGEYQKAAEEGGQTQLMKDSAALKEKVLESFEIKEWGLFEG